MLEFFLVMGWNVQHPVWLQRYLVFKFLEDVRRGVGLSVVAVEVAVVALVEQQV